MKRGFPAMRRLYASSGLTEKRATEAKSTAKTFISLF